MIVEAKRLYLRLSLLIVLLQFPLHAISECVKDLRGEVYCGAGRCVIGSEKVYDNKYGTVWCSRFKDGGIGKTLDGHVVCGKGDCAKDTNGIFYCSSAPGGSVLIDSKGNVRCYEGCERAKLDYCENTKADSSSSY